ncbi:hypothetical protein roselon_02951 [Roseibacterium elongatum DSM 19469]|uniref:Uncharacterized protein n=1 Tax=Roseicyclus elongatus DSM 19469 TaxID=1294273 RepID=W8S8E3_9RHOB|nr:hypothetical protein [Roseibacterium elongatum]AHM05236.1 hypothetical protein roselon_02951 [Roseibacterium elongatum DSM 19469]
MSTPVADRHEVSALWRWQLPLALALFTFVLRYTYPEFSRFVILTEGWGPVELSHFVMPFLTGVVAIACLMSLPEGSQKALRIWFILLMLGGFFIAGEEHSWGQHFFNWSTPEYWAELNRQQETNLHNSSSWFNQKPQLVLQVSVLFAVVILPLGTRYGRFSGLRERFAFVLPGISTYAIGRFMVFYAIWDQLAKNLDFPEISTREAEVMETYLYGFLLIYAITMFKRIKRHTTGAA